MFGKYRKYLKVTTIDMLVYAMTQDDIAVAPPILDPGFIVSQATLPDGKKLYSITEKGQTVHKSFVFEKLRLLRLIGKDGPAIGDCYTNEDYRGKAIYPFVINKIARDLLSSGVAEVFIIVGRDNHSSIRGIEKAGFHLHSEIKAKRFLLFFYSVKIVRHR
jgi:hypothetical protein